MTHDRSFKSSLHENVPSLKTRFCFGWQIEDGWWMGKKNNQIGAFPSNFVKEIFAPLKGDVH